ncbi:MAG: hypothetical protein RLY78_1387 [Pseudomonadota bacterium]
MPAAAQPDYDVAIVGYGPAGAVAAALLGQAGHRVHVCDRLTDVHEIPRAIALDHEILRVFQGLGIADAVAAHCEPFTDSVYHGVDGQVIRRMTMLDQPWPQGHVPSIVFTQPPVERLLRQRIAQMANVTVALGVECTAVEQHGDDAPGGPGVTLTVDGRPVRARWAIAADGGSSGLRALLGLSLEDLDFDEPWLVVDALVNERGLARLPATSVQYCEPERPCTFVIGPGHHRRWEISLKPGEDPRQAATPEGTWALLQRWMGPEDGTLWRQSAYRFHALVAAQWRAGRVFLAGDAAHMQPPFLGQGMCQGVRDVANLAWKLDAVLRGTVQGAVADALLDSYGAERKAHVQELTTRIKAVGAVICERDVERARARDARLLAEAGGPVRPQPRQDVLPPLTGGLCDGSAGAGTLFPQPRLQATATRPEAWMDARHGSGWRLVSDGSLPVDVPAGLCHIDLAREPEAEGVVAAWLARHGARAALLRPDHYTLGSAADAAGIERLIAAWRRGGVPAA